MIRSLVVILGACVAVPVAGAVASTDRHISGGPTQRFLPWTVVADQGHHLFSHRTVTPPPSPSSQPSGSPAGEPSGRPAGTPIGRPKSGAPTSGAPADEVPIGHLPTGMQALPAQPRIPLAPLADLRLLITAPSRVRHGATFSYTIRVANHGLATPSEVTVKNTLPEGVTRTGARLPSGVGGYAGAHEATLTFPRIAPGRSMAVYLKVRTGRATKGRLIAHSKITYTAGARLPSARHAVAQAVTHVR